MLTIYSSKSRGALAAGLPRAPLPPDVVWIDILNGTPDEIGAVEQATGITVPSLASLQEIEHSSRMRRDDDWLVLSLPLPAAATQGTTLTPVGFVLRQSLLLTVRFDVEPAFDQFVEGFAQNKPPDGSAPSVLVGLMEAVTDTLADRLEEAGSKLDLLAGRIFNANKHASRHGRLPKIKSGVLREMIRQVGHTGQVLGKLRASLLTLGRLVPYLEAEGKAWIKAATTTRIGTLRADIASLDEYETHLSDKVQFLLDAALGLINMEQNDSFKVLTIVSVVGIPPTLVASMYGMNFHNMPELSWAWGYPYGLAMIVLSAVVPLIFFKVRGWF